MKKIFLTSFSLIVVLLLLLSAWIFYESRAFLHTPPQPAETAENRVIEIQQGENLTQITRKLEELGLVTDAFRFKLLVRLKQQDTQLQAGRFLLNTGWLPERVLEEIVTGKALLSRLTIREGLTWWEVAALLEKEGFATADDFTRIIHDPEFLRHHGIPFKNAEGFLYPETYFIHKPNPDALDEKSARDIANRLVYTFWQRTTPLFPNGKKPATSELKRLLALASIIEKETSLPEERNRVAGVYSNRLKTNMLLQADPTVAYGLGPDFKGPLLKKHLEDAKNPYNTYVNVGLPPGPICSPSAASIKAAISPENHSYYYFVARSTNPKEGHVFSKTLQEHNRAVQSYRRAQGR